MESVPAEVGVYGTERLRELAERPNTQVLTVEHDHVRDPYRKLPHPMRLQKV